MRIWKIESDVKGYNSLQLVNFEDDQERYFGKFESSTPLQKSWGEVQVYTIEEGEFSDLPHFWGYSKAMVTSEKAKKVLELKLSNSVEFLPLQHKEEKYYVLHVLSIFQAVDYESVLLRKLPTGLVIGFEKYAFKPEVINGHNIFKVFLNERVYGTETFVSDEIKEIVEENNLKGFKFIEVWSK
ncbi:imm11 family protein [Paenibacillus oleatilyticus]|uniref:Imm11 family protein n=1 Tax=Paenibacillus oleatilyticus TaxID=2594886 RepID=A0ABV4V335_9BACL